MAIDPATGVEAVVPPAGTIPAQTVPEKKNAKGELIDDEGMTVAERKESRELYKALQDPKRARILVETLAREAGLLDSSDKRSDKTKKNEFVEILEEALGEEYKFLAPKLGPAFEKMMSKHKEELDSRFGDVDMKRIQDESDAALISMRKDYADFALFENAIQALMEELPPDGSKLSQKDYLKKLYRLAKSEAQDDEKRAEKAKRNRTDGTQIPPHGGTDKSNKQETTAPKGIRAAVTAAMEDMEAAD